MNDDYRALVGPAALYDEIGALQFMLLVSLGMRSQHALLDIGCGTLRLGRLAIPYLDEGNYYGLEPDQKKLVAGVSYEVGATAGDDGYLGMELSELSLFRAPHFDSNDQFNLTVFERKFDYLVAHSIFTHANQSQIKACIASAAKVIAPAGLFAFTYFPGGKNHTGREWAPKARYQTAFFSQLAESCGLRCSAIAWPHPKKQRWLLACHPGVKPKLDYTLKRA